MVCTFFGHRVCPYSVKAELKCVLKRLIEKCDVDDFYVGNHGHFDEIVLSTLRELKKLYPHIRYSVVLAYMPGNADKAGEGYFAEAILPEGIETKPPHYAIVWRNRWMIDRADYVVTYITHSFGGAAKFAEIAKRKNKHVININE